MAIFERTANGFGHWAALVETMGKKDPKSRSLLLGLDPIQLCHIPVGAWLQRIDHYWYLMWME